jgi:2,3-bisphosphoglycerate-dependent phosphoglycerate mutase
MGLTKPHEVGGLYWYDEESGEAMGQTGPNRAHFEEHYPALLLPEEVGETGWWNERIEHRDAVIERAEEVLASLLEKHKGTDDRVGLVSHGGFYQRFMTAVFHLDAQHLHETSPHRYRFAINNCAITRFEFGEDFTGLVYQNRVDFLLPSLITV